MGLSREARIITLLAIDSTFFFLEIMVGKHHITSQRPVSS